MAIDPARCIEGSRHDSVPWIFFQEVCGECSDKRHLRDRWRLDDELNEVEDAIWYDKKNGHGILRLRIASYT